MNLVTHYPNAVQHGVSICGERMNADGAAEKSPGLGATICKI